ncbi:MAG: sigma-54-dependent Fis family transcriptional regulator, partial [Myxococcales bacterium]|nr:sigma-54-dependent Fis family transcriptional regulator [Myxococcales bacterium]
RGAFTGAVSQHEGVFVRAHGGTLFMDEVGELSPAAQARMLRVLENRTLTRVGGTKEISVDVRLIAATHRDLPQMVKDGTFRQDLLYRLSVIQTQLPPLRERREDIPALAAHFVEVLGESIGRRVTEISPAALEVLQRYRWPGNVRELRNVIERALVLGDGPIVDVDDLAPELAHAAPLAPSPGPRAPAQASEVRPLSELEREAIDAALLATGGNKARAAALLGIDRSTLYRKLKDHGLR